MGVRRPPPTWRVPARRHICVSNFGTIFDAKYGGEDDDWSDIAFEVSLHEH